MVQPPKQLASALCLAAETFGRWGKKTMDFLKMFAKRKPRPPSSPADEFAAFRENIMTINHCSQGHRHQKDRRRSGRAAENHTAGLEKRFGAGKH
ncbi:unnamed protein product [Vitrella brassicaformis CCMP3155]|uniref:Uncharacterized protein n=1 Tax=Vitrella brassicaformis (strain CCMP3155) TaxID=1169540 RepID=A0A0G4FH65_VITBC|nr:unnamed protein product [Vitrella brassicaformis CCMP3155]|eukprot:CEM12198.1 unnamed protein product [Vitrella brassicaformis CCMP3155]